MAEAVIVLDLAFMVGKTDPRLFGSFVSIWGDVFMEGSSSLGTRQLTMKVSDEMYWNWSANSGSL
jgi:hypothetical protein